MSKKPLKTAEKAADISVIPKTPMRFILHVSRPHKWFAVSAILCVTFAQTLGSFSPYLFKQMIDRVTGAADVVAQADALLFWGVAFIVLLFFMWLFWRCSGFLGLEWSTRVHATAYSELYKYLSAHSHAYFSNAFAGSLSNKVSNAANGAARLVEDSLWRHYSGVLSLFITAGLLFYTNVVFGGIFSVLIVLLILINVPLVKIRRPHVVAYAQASSAFRGMGVDMLTNIAAVRQYAQRSRELQMLSTSVSTMRSRDVRQWRISEWGLGLNNLVILAAISSVLYAMIVFFQDGLITMGDVVLILTLLFQASHTLTFIGASMGSVIRMYGEIEEGLEEVLKPHEVIDTSEIVLHVSEAKIEFSDVLFEYEEGQIFSSFNLTINSGERLGLVGPSGAGKTTFVSLLLRQHDIQAGEILIDGQNIAEVTQDSLRSAIAVVPQEPLLFHRSIHENIAYGKPQATREEVIEVAKKARAHEFVSELADGYDTLVGERGVKLSGGQRQRVAIARAMLKDAPILVLDEATSALDSESEVAIQTALHELMEGKTVIAIAHRLSTLREMDRIVVMDKGVVVEDGTHEELSARDGLYAKLWTHQAGGFIQE